MPPTGRLVPSQSRCYKHLVRTLSFKANETQSTVSKAYSNTLLLPRTPFKLQPDVKDIEANFRKLTCEDLYRWQWENAKGPLFVLHDGPPYANGDLHMGHALNKVTKDIINRFHVSQGRKVHYVPGWDCHGLPIEGKAINDKKLSPHDTPANVIREAARSTAVTEMETQKEQFRSLAIMADWDSNENTYRTLDRHYEMRQLRIFQKMVANGLIYRQHRPVYYSPSSRSALAEAELEYNDHVSESAYVAFDLDPQCRPIRLELAEAVARGIVIKFLVWTTTPWTLTANMGIAVHEDLDYDLLLDGKVGYLVSSNRVEVVSKILNFERITTLVSLPGKDLIGLRYKPLFEEPKSLNSFEIIHAPHVTSDSGTGLVHLAPAHGAEDYNVFRLQGFFSTSNPKSTLLCHVDGKGHFSPDVAEVVGEEDAISLVGRDVLYSGSKNILRLLKKWQRLVGTEKIAHKYPYDWRTKKPVIVTATSQWFANLDQIKDDALKALKSVSFFPPLSRNRLESFVQSRSEWCISRQRVWGVPIPALHHKYSDRVVLDTKSLDYILNAMEKKSLDWWTAPIEDFVPPWLLEDGHTAAETWEKGQDTMDVWFDSGTSWSMLVDMGVGKNQEYGRMVHADLCLEGSDQHRGWFQSQVLTALGSASSNEEKFSPYGALMTHGMVLDEQGRKMSKSLGNVVSPMAVIQHGADVLRLWIATVDYWKDMSIGASVLSQIAKSLKKLRNTARFCLGNLEADGMAVERVPKNEMGLAERYIMNELYNLEQAALESYANYNFQKVISNLNTFANATISSLYFDITKDVLYANQAHSLERIRVITVLEQVLNVLTNIVAPILPYLAEEIHAIRKADRKSVFMTPWVPLSRDWKDPEALEDMTDLLSLRGTVLSLLEKAREAKQLSSSLGAEIDVILPDSDLMADNRFVHTLRREESFLKTLFIVSDAVITDEGSLGSTSPNWVHSKSVSIADVDVAVRVRPASRQKCPRCWTFARLKGETLCDRCKEVIGHT